jgi:hypothetical protein
VPIEIVGLKDLRKELRAVPDASVRELNTALDAAAKAVTARTVALMPKKSGAMAGTAKAFKNASGAGVKVTHPGANVQEFATTYRRQGKKGPNTVHLVNVQPKGDSGGRFAHKAVDELAPVIIDETFNKILDVVRMHGWFA